MFCVSSHVILVGFHLVRYEFTRAALSTVRITSAGFVLLTRFHPPLGVTVRGLTELFCDGFPLACVGNNVAIVSTCYLNSFCCLPF